MCHQVKATRDSVLERLRNVYESEALYKITLVLNIAILLLNLCKIVFGVFYWNDCDIHVIKFLVVSGGLSTVLILVYVMEKLLYLKSKYSENIIGCQSCSLYNIHLSFIITGVILHLSLNIIWGSVVVFHSYSYWTYNDDTINETPENDDHLSTTRIVNFTSEDQKSVKFMDHLSDATSNKELHIYCPFLPFTFCFVTLIMEYAISPLLAIYYFYKTKNFYFI